MWNIAKKAALNKPSLEYFRKHIDEKKDRERKRKYEKNTVSLFISLPDIQISGVFIFCSLAHEINASFVDLSFLMKGHISILFTDP